MFQKKLSETTPDAYVSFIRSCSDHKATTSQFSEKYKEDRLVHAMLTSQLFELLMPGRISFSFSYVEANVSIKSEPSSC